MTDKKAYLFWGKHAILAIVVLGAALFFLRYNPEHDAQANIGGAKSSDSGDSISDNLTRFYKEFRYTSKDPIVEEYGDFVIALDLPEKSQTQQLVAILSVDQPPAAAWSGEYKVRSFAKDTTIRTEAMKYAEQEGMQLIWDLNQDFIIRGRFLSKNSLLGTLEEVAGAIDANFVPEVKVYFCKEKRTIVIAEKVGTYVSENCKKVDTN
jgi:hypothetical protein